MMPQCCTQFTCIYLKEVDAEIKKTHIPHDEHFKLMSEIYDKAYAKVVADQKDGKSYKEDSNERIMY